MAVEKLSWVLSDSVIRAILRIMPYRPARDIMRITDTMARRSKEIVEEKKEALARGDACLAHEVGEGKDIMSICCALRSSASCCGFLTEGPVKANMAATDNEKMTDEEIYAQTSCVSSTFLMTTRIDDL